jgi:hypothetical protein
LSGSPAYSALRPSSRFWSAPICGGYLFWSRTI